MFWSIHGRKYDLTEFIDKHPGGADIIIKTKGERDITSIFETSHAFANRKEIRKTLESYELKDGNNESSDIKIYDFSRYEYLISEVKILFPNSRSIKSTYFWFVINSINFLLYFYFFISSIFDKNLNILLKMLYPIFAGVLWLSIGFSIMHDSSHNGVSINPNINTTLSKLWNGFGLWNSNIWFYHHVLNHHSFTSLSKQDPDLYHLAPYVRKVKDTTKVFKFSVSNQDIIVHIILFIIPGLYFGQALSYVSSRLSRKEYLWEIKLPNHIVYYDTITIVLILLKLFCFHNGDWYVNIIYIVTINIFYTINIISNHDTYETNIDNHYTGNDWVRLQISNSGNCLNNNLVWSFLFGCINHQIEHHLFPTMSNVHYPTIAPIVKKYCKENNIPYNHHNSLYSVYKSYIKMINHMKND